MRQVWTTSERRWLVELAPTHTVVELAEKLERDKRSIISMLTRLEISAKPQNKVWTQREHRVVEGMLQDFSYEDIAKELGRSSASVRSYIRSNFKVKPRRIVWKPTREQIDRIAQMRADRVKLTVIARTMRCTEENLKHVVKRENIKRGIGYVR